MGMVDISRSVQTSRPVIPQIYAYTTPEVPRHNGWTKIGYTEQEVEKRVWQQTHTVGIRPQIEWHLNATWEDGSGTFKDTDFHSYLQRIGYPREEGNEWFEIKPIDAKNHLRDFRENHGVLDTPSAVTYQLRTEQLAAVEKTLDYARLHDRGEFLWNAKPRFGKTLASYDLIKKLGAKRVLIVTNRPAIANSWYDDYVKFIGTEGGYCFVSSVDALAGKPYCVSREQYRKGLLNNRFSESFIEFVSLQDLKGSIRFGGSLPKLNEVADLEWDILIIDEAHEGVDTFKTDVAFDHISRKFTLHLSGTPFKAIANEKFAEDAIYNWTYADEQQAKRDWDNPELPNPYANLPQLNMFTYQMSDIVLDQVSQGVDIDGETVEYAFDLNEFFLTNDQGRFIHDSDVDTFLDALTVQKKFPFSTPKLRDELRHTFWILNRVDSARALAKKLRRHPVFKDYEVILAAGDGKLDDADESQKAFDRVHNAIAQHDKTITLSVGQLTTGITIPEWTAVLMLSNMKSPALYMQAAFRAQNPCLFYIKETNKYLRKENAYVFDFDPARTLTIVEEFANDLYTDTAAGTGDADARRQHIRRLLNFFPVIGENEDGEMIELDAEKVLSIPRKIRSREIVRRGFMSNYLFQNISNVFRAPEEVVQIIQKFDPYKAPNEDLGIKHDTAEELSLDSEGNVDIPDEQVIGTASSIFGEKRYEDIGGKLQETVDVIQQLPSNVSEEDIGLERLTKQFVNELAQPLVETAQQYYGKNLKAKQQKNIQRRITEDVKSTVNLEIGNYAIKRNTLEQNRKDALDAANTDAEIEQINRQYDEHVKEARQELVDNLDQSSKQLIENSAATIVRVVETAKKETIKQNIEQGIRDHLRGFSRTIPMFLMAYGDEHTTLKNFDTIIPEDVFLDVTGITVKQFRLLRDGGDVVNDETGESMHFNGQLFDLVSFNDSVREFIRLRGELANYFDESISKDIFDYVPAQKTNQIFTPRHVVVQMLDLFEQENPGCFDDPEHTFADLYMKSGLYITEVIKRLYNSERMRELFPDDRQRLDHILERQVFGIAPSEIIYRIATHFILGFNDEIGNGCKTNFVIADSAKLAKEGKLAAFVEQTFGARL